MEKKGNEGRSTGGTPLVSNFYTRIFVDILDNKKFENVPNFKRCEIGITHLTAKQYKFINQVDFFSWASTVEQGLPPYSSVGPMSDFGISLFRADAYRADETSLIGFEGRSPEFLRGAELVGSRYVGGTLKSVFNPRNCHEIPSSINRRYDQQHWRPPSDFPHFSTGQGSRI